MISLIDNVESLLVVASAVGETVEGHRTEAVVLMKAVHWRQTKPRRRKTGASGPGTRELLRVWILAG